MNVADEPYGNIQRSASGLNRGGNLSEQKTPTAHPNTFLYRAHLNMNDCSAHAKEDQDIELFNAGLQNSKLSKVS